ncbi:MAG: twin-arginine translocation signal domain-containing protein, partial [Dermabacter sp.]|nr:twin-arginine translocation signal domain-containing protein [Dermabacter sp.]
MFNPTRRSVLAATAAGAAVAGLAACSNDNSKGSGAA